MRQLNLLFSLKNIPKASKYLLSFSGLSISINFKAEFSVFQVAGHFNIWLMVKGRPNMESQGRSEATSHLNYLCRALLFYLGFLYLFDSHISVCGSKELPWQQLQQHQEIAVMTLCHVFTDQKQSPTSSIQECYHVVISFAVLVYQKMPTLIRS